ncbi:MAG: hypothetical protein D4R80_00570 [Deltaproteobacteria bacterium]|nr:MAG: hypothetical protein D4R80_00570 [Deltaproteobacteria bacterium]
MRCRRRMTSRDKTLIHAAANRMSPWIIPRKASFRIRQTLLSFNATQKQWYMSENRLASAKVPPGPTISRVTSLPPGEIL